MGGPRESAQTAKDRAELWLVLGQSCLQAAESLLPPNKSARELAALVDEGLGAIEQSLKLAPGFPRALAIQGALSLRKGQRETDPVKKRAALELAREALAKGLQGNPLLQHRYGPAASAAAEVVKKS